MKTDFLVSRFEERGDAPAVIAPAGGCTYRQLLELWREWDREFDRLELSRGTVVSLEGDFTPNSIAAFLALLQRPAIVVLRSNAVTHRHQAQDEIAEIEACIHVDDADEARFERTGRVASHSLYGELRDREHPGVVAFSSGTTGEPKGTVIDFNSWLRTFEVPRPAMTTLTFLLFEHLGGTRTMLHTLANGATLVSTVDRSPDTICRLIEEHRVELLPATPTFFNLMLLSGAHRRFDMSSLKVISYGAEPMHQTTLDCLYKDFPSVRLLQTYGLIETGPMRSRSRADSSLWVSVGGEEIDVRVVDGILQIRSPLTTIGYLNALTPITDDGWFITGDAVEQDGEYLRFLGRASELINVGGRKVYPAEVENVIQEMSEVEDVRVFGEPHRLIGEIVCAEVKLRDPAHSDGFPARLKNHCRERFDRFKVPVKVEVVDDVEISDRFKKLRRPKV